MVEFGTLSAFRGWVRVRVLGYGFGVRGRKVKSRDCALASDLVRAVCAHAYGPFFLHAHGKKLPCAHSPSRGAAAPPRFAWRAPRRAAASRQQGLTTLGNHAQHLRCSLRGRNAKKHFLHIHTKIRFHLTRCLRTLRARRALAREGLWSE